MKKIIIVSLIVLWFGFVIGQESQKVRQRDRYRQAYETQVEANNALIGIIGTKLSELKGKDFFMARFIVGYNGDDDVVYLTPATEKGKKSYVVVWTETQKIEQQAK